MTEGFVFLFCVYIFMCVCVCERACLEVEVSEGYYGRLEPLLLDVTSPVCGHFTVASLPSAQWIHTMVQKKKK